MNINGFYGMIITGFMAILALILIVDSIKKKNMSLYDKSDVAMITIGFIYFTSLFGIFTYYAFIC